MGSYYQNIKFKYEKDDLKIYYRKLQQKHAKYKQHKKFLFTCREYGFIPNHIKYSTNLTKKLLKNSNSQQYYNKIELEFHRKLLNIEITEFRYSIKTIENTIKLIGKRIKKKLSNFKFEQFIAKQKIIYENLVSQQQQLNLDNLEKLKSSFLNSLNIKIHDKWFVNKTSVEFPNDIKWLLSMGQNFALPIDRHDFPLFQLIADGDVIIETIKDKTKQKLMRSRFCDMLHNFQKNNNNDQFGKYVLKVCKDAAAFLKRNQNIIILTDDSGNFTVAMNKSDYEVKMDELLSDRSMYRELRVNPRSSLQKTNNEFVNYLHKKNIITDEEKENMAITYTPKLPSIYGLPNLHDQNTLLRPFLSSIKVPCYELSKYIAGKLHSITNTSEYKVKNSIEFIEKAKQILIGQNDVMVTFDAVPFFIDIRIIKNVVEENWNVLKENTSIIKTKFLEILEFCLKENNIFWYKENLYKQLHGIPQENPLSLPILDLVLDFLLNEIKLEFAPKFIARKINKIFAVVKKNEVDNVLEYLNNFNPNIQFTMEKEANETITFLEVRIYREMNDLSFDWYKKDDACRSIVNFQSNEPIDIILTSANNYVNEVLTISDTKFHTTNKQKLTEILVDKGYPRNEIHFLLEKHKKFLQITNEITDNIKSMVYVPELAEEFTKIILNKANDVNIVYNSNKTLNTTLFTKLTVDNELDLTTDVIYKINCLGNNKENCRNCYIGITQTPLKTRFANHKADLKSSSPKKSKTALKSHCEESNHKPDFDNAIILQIEKDLSKIQILEVLHILNHKNTINKRQDTKDIISVYGSLVSTNNYK